MKLVMPAMVALAVTALAGCDRPATSTSSTTVVKEPTVVQKETVVQAPPAPATNGTIEAPKSEAPKTETTETSRSITRETPMGTATRTETTKTTQ